jgi:hypothetical protein
VPPLVLALGLFLAAFFLMVFFATFFVTVAGELSGGDANAAPLGEKTSAAASVPETRAV